MIPPPGPSVGRAELRDSSRPPPRNRRVERPPPAPELPAKAAGVPFWRRPALRARVRQTGRVVLALGIFAGLALGAKEVHRYALTAPAFALRTLHVEGNERLPEGALLAAAGVALGDNVFTHAPSAVKAALEAHPWVAEAQVERRLPGTLRISVAEHRPVALLLAGEGYLVGEDASLFKRWLPGDPADLPVVTGVDRERFASDRAYRTALLRELVALTRDHRAAGLWRRLPLQEVHVEANGHLSLYAGEGPLYVRLGAAPHGPQLRRLRRVLDRLAADELEAAYVFLDNVRRPDRVTVRLREVRLREVPSSPPSTPG